MQQFVLGAARFKHMASAVIGGVLLGVTALATDGLTDDDPRADLALVVGSKVLANGEPSPRLEARLARALELYRTGATETLLVSGGRGASGHDEGAVMQRYLIDRGVPEAAVLVDEHGLDTWSSAQHAAFHLHRHGGTSITVVSQLFHISRARLALNRCGVTDVRGAHARFFELRDVYSALREVPAYLAYSARPAHALGTRQIRPQR
jgi:vancomycin permeability regulator SanA